MCAGAEKRFIFFELSVADLDFSTVVNYLTNFRN